MSIETLNKLVYARQVPIVTLTIVLTLVGGCSVTEVKEKLEGGVEIIKDKLPAGNKGKSCTSAKDIALVKNFALDDVPHTLMRKPLAHGVLTSTTCWRLRKVGIPLPQKHRGVDYGAKTGTAIFAAGSGTIERLYLSTSYGNYIKIKHKNGFSTAYAHMDSFADGLKTGSQVIRGQVIGTVGNTGRSTGPHLHFELIYGDRFIDPLFKYNPKQDES